MMARFLLPALVSISRLNLAFVVFAVTQSLNADPLPPAQANALIAKHCAVCHNDLHLNGGLSLTGFDVTNTDPTIAAMLISKMTNLSLEEIRTAQYERATAERVLQQTSKGAMMAAGVKPPDGPTQLALLGALLEATRGADKWAVRREPDRTVTVSALRQMPSPTRSGETLMYRLTLACDARTGMGNAQITWSPDATPKDSVMMVRADQRPATEHIVEGPEKLFPGTLHTMGTGVLLLHASREVGERRPLMRIPKKALEVNGLFSNQPIEFRFDKLPGAARKDLRPCFPE